MCGIICILSNSKSEHLLDHLKQFENNIARRGVTGLNCNTFQTSSHSLLFAATVLWLQGGELTSQPINCENSIFLYNGDVFGGAISKKDRIRTGDTYLFMKTYLQGANAPRHLLHNQGPYAFIYLNKLQNEIWFGRDVYGRRSLLIGYDRNCLILTSVAKRKTQFKFIELPSLGTFCYNLDTDTITLYPWTVRNNNFNKKIDELKVFLNKNIAIKDVEIEKRHCFTSPNLNDLNIFKLKQDNIFEELLANNSYLKNVERLKELLENSVKSRIELQPNHCSKCCDHTCYHSTTGVLFSGGIDCAILALLVDKFVSNNRPIDLINVAFDRVKNFQTPDRLSGIQTLNELKQLAPNRQWNFVEINVSQMELDSERTRHIADLIYPLNTILDDSLGCALWFAGRGKSETYTSTCRIVFVGMGADELFGGYTRHRAALKHSGWDGLHNALEEDWQNLSHRNLGRDDRIISDHCRQLRTPYLDEQVVEFVRNLNSWEKTCPSDDFPQGVGEKILLRTLGYYLGLKGAASMKKRALQFGSRIANPKENAKHVSLRLV